MNETTEFIWQIIFMVIGAVFGIFQIVFFYNSLKYLDPRQVALIQPLDLVFGFLLQHIFLGINSDLFGYVGASLIMFGVILIILMKYYEFSKASRK